MKNPFVQFLVLLLLFAIPGSFSLVAGTIHTVNGTVKYSDGTSPASVSYQANIVGRSSEILTQTSPGCGYGSGSYFIQCGSFPTNWTAGEQLTVSLNDNQGFSVSGTVTLTNNPSDLLNIVIPRPDISATPLSKNYGDVVVGASSPQIFTVSNTGTANLNVTSSSLTGTDAAMFQILNGANAFTLSPGGSKEVTVQFQPSSSGGKTATLQFVSNDPDEGTFNISLSGTAIAQPDIAISPTSKNYGSVVLGQSKQQIFSISNTGSASLEVTSTSLSGGQSDQFAIINGGGAFSLASGASHDMTVRFTPSSVGTKSTSLSIASNDPDENPLTISLSGSGIVIPDIHSAQTDHSYGDVYLGSSSSFTFQIQNTGNGDLHVSSTTLGGTCPGQFAIKGGGGTFTVVPGGSRNVIVAFEPTILGYSSSILILQSDDPDENPYNLTISGNGIAIPAPNISVSPTSYQYGSLVVGTGSNKTFVVSNTGNADLHLSGIALSGSEASHFSIQSGGSDATVTPGSQQNIVVRFQPLSVGSKSALLSITSDDPDQNPVTLQLSGQGTLPDISVTPSSYDFGNVLWDHTADKCFMIKNEGSATLTINSIQFSGTSSGGFAIADNPAPLSLGPGESQCLTIYFTPMTLETHTGEITIQHNVANKNPSVISLAGRGVIPDIEINPLSINFGFISVGSNLVKELRISNTGTAVLHVGKISLIGENSNSFACLSETSFSVSAGQSKQVQVQFKPAEIGAKSAQLKLECDDPDESEITVILSGNDESPDILLSQSQLDFGQVLINTIDTLSLTLANQGHVDLEVSNCRIIGNDENNFSLLQPQSIAVGPSESIILQIAFAPLSIGSKSASLEITSNDPDETVISLPLEGVGVFDDHQGPEIVYFYPLGGAFDVPVNTSIQFQIRDFGYGLDFTSINLSVNQINIITGGEDQTGGHVSLYPTEQGVQITYKPEGGFEENSESRIALTCKDLAPWGNTCSGQFHFQTGFLESIELSSWMVDETGGIFEDSTTGLILNIPQGALNGPINIQLAIISYFAEMPDTAIAIGWHYLMEPIGLDFEKKITIGIPYSDLDLQEVSVAFARDLPVYSYDPAHQILNKEDVWDTTDQTIFIQLDRSVYLTFAKETNTTSVALPMDLFSNIPESFGLDQNYPNPFNPVTSISFQVKEPCRVQLNLFDMRGQRVMPLVDAEYPPGSFAYIFTAENLPSGVYVYAIQMRNYSSRKKLLLLK